MFFFLFSVFEKMSSSLPILLVMLFVHVGNRSNSCSKIFFKTSVLKNFAIFTGNTRVGVSLIKLQDRRPAFLLNKRHKRRCLPVNIVNF